MEKADIIKYYEKKYEEYEPLKDDLKKMQGVQAENKELKLIIE